MRVSHRPVDVSALFDDPNLLSFGVLAPVLSLAQRAGLADLVADKLTVSGEGAGNAALKVPALVAGMVAGADSIEAGTCSATVGWASCSPASGRPRRWALSCLRSSSATSASSMRWPRVAKQPGPAHSGAGWCRSGGLRRH